MLRQGPLGPVLRSGTDPEPVSIDNLGRSGASRIGATCEHGRAPAVIANPRKLVTFLSFDAASPAPGDPGKTARRS